MLWTVNFWAGKGKKYWGQLSNDEKKESKRQHWPVSRVFSAKVPRSLRGLGHLTQLHFCQCVEINQISLFFPINQHLICSRPSILHIYPLVRGVMDKTPEANTFPLKPSSQLPPSMSAAASVQCGVSNTYVEFQLWVTQVSSVMWVMLTWSELSLWVTHCPFPPTVHRTSSSPKPKLQPIYKQWPVGTHCVYYYPSWRGYSHRQITSNL